MQEIDPTVRALVEFMATGELKVINIGLERFAEVLSANGIQVVHVDWRPPAQVDHDLVEILDALRSPDEEASGGG